MFFSVIIPTHTRKRDITHALSSLILQTYPHWEALVVDNEEDGRTETLLRPLLAKERRIRYIKKRYESMNDARALGVSAARGDIITFLDPDDYISPTHLEAHHDFFHDHPRVDMIFGNPTIIGSPYLEHSNHQNSTQYNHVNHSAIHGTFFINEQVFDTIHTLPTTDYSDGELLHTLIKNHGFITKKIPMPTYIYDRGND